MRLNFWKQFLPSVMLALAFSGFANADITFNFDNGTAFDGGGAGAMMVATDITTGDSATLTTVDIFAPEYDDAGMLTNTVLSALNGDGVVTNIASGTNAIGVNNPSIGPADYTNLVGGTGTETEDFNPGEGWVISFDQDIIFTEFNFATIDTGNESFDVTIAGGPTVNFASGTASDDFDDPFGSTVVTAGTNVTFTAVGDVDVDCGSHFRN